MLDFAQVKGDVFFINTGSYKIVTNDEFIKVSEYYGNMSRKPSLYSFKENLNYWFGSFINPGSKKYNEVIKIATMVGLNIILRKEQGE